MIDISEAVTLFPMTMPALPAMVKRLMVPLVALNGLVVVSAPLLLIIKLLKFAPLLARLKTPVLFATALPEVLRVRFGVTRVRGDPLVPMSPAPDDRDIEVVPVRVCPVVLKVPVPLALRVIAVALLFIVKIKPPLLPAVRDIGPAESKEVWT